jgi:hydroxyacylglutathione hydrolase
VLQIELLPLLSDNYAYLLLDPAEGTSGVVDPGEAGPVLAALRERGRERLDLILCTHHHGDHVAGVAALKDAFAGCRVVGPAGEAARIPGLDRGVAEGEEVEFGRARLRVIETPGHTRGHVSLHDPEVAAVFCGDTLFALGCGRLLEGDAPMMWRSLAKLAALPGDTRVYCGHEYTQSNARFALSVDPDNAALVDRAAGVDRARAAGRPTIPATIGEERATNPFLRVADPAIRAKLGLRDAPDEQVLGELRRRKDHFR